MATFDNIDLTKKQMVNMSDLFKQKEYQDAYVSSDEMVKVSDAVDRLIVITGYREETMPDSHNRDEYGKPRQKPCFRMDFYFDDEGADHPHYIRTEAKYLWRRLKSIHAVNPDILSSGTVRTMICNKSKKGMMGMADYYDFAGM